MAGQDPKPTARPSWPVHGWVGLALVAVSWSLNWSLDGLRTHWAFFLLWLGYCLLFGFLLGFLFARCLLVCLRFTSERLFARLLSGLFRVRLQCYRLRFVRRLFLSP